MFKLRGSDKLSREDIKDDDWHEFIKGMVEASKNQASSTTFAAAINYLRERQPKIAIFENVESAPWESTASYVFPLAGYSIKIVKLDTKNYYLPQTRSRKYVIAFSHRAFGIAAALNLCGQMDNALRSLSKRYSSVVTDFLLPVNNYDLHRARNEMELAALSGQDREFNWSLSKARHQAFRESFGLGDSRPWIQWKENGSSNAPAKMWKPWEARQPNRVSDMLECMFLVGITGNKSRHGSYDPRFKSQIIDCSQNVDRAAIPPSFGMTGCLTPCAIPVLTLEARPITGLESLRLQGMPVENFDMSVETQSQLQDLAGNAMATTVVGAALLASLSRIAHYSSQNGLNWLPMLFPTNTCTTLVQKDQNSFANQQTMPGDFENLSGPVLAARCNLSQGVSEILSLGSRTRRRCVCYHILSYSSMELFECQVCAESFCKSCKGNPEHQLVKSAKSFDELNCLSFSDAEERLQDFFPPVIPMLSRPEPSLESATLRDMIHVPARHTLEEADILANRVLTGLCKTVYQLKFVEITQVTRIEYHSKDDFILRVIIEAEQIVWYLHWDQWSQEASKLNGKHKTETSIARAILGPDATSQLPTCWEPWLPQQVDFTLRFRRGADDSLHLVSADIQEFMKGTEFEHNIAHLKDTVWVKHEECGFPEYALWVTTVGGEKLYLFKDVSPTGPSAQDEFVITTVCREMGRTPVPEIRPALLRIMPDFQPHRMITNMPEGSNFSVSAYVPGRWLREQKQLIRLHPNATDCVNQPFPTSLPVNIHRPDRDLNMKTHGGQFSCHREQTLLEMSLPIFGRSKLAISDDILTLRSLDLSQQLDFAEFVRLVGPCYLAVERHILAYLNGSRTLQLWEAEIDGDCETCAPRLPQMLWEKQKGQGSHSLGSMVAQCLEADQKVYDSKLRKKPLSFRIDHRVLDSKTSSEGKDERFHYVDVRFIARAHTLLQQARSFHHKHPAYHQDSVLMKGIFSVEFGVLDDPRQSLDPIVIQPPKYEKASQQPPGFRKDMSLFDEQLASLEWMITRENDEDEINFTEREVAEVYIDRLRFRIRAQTSKQTIRRGRVVADSVGFGKTAVCLGLIDRQHNIDRTDFLELRKQNEILDGVVHLHATLVIVPNQLTEQWRKESERFLNASYSILTISTFQELINTSISRLQKADVVICSNKVFQDTKYTAHLSKLSDPAQLDVTAVPKVYRAWYETTLQILAMVRKQIIAFLRPDSKFKERQALLGEIRNALENIRRKDGPDLHLAFNPAKDVDKWTPQIILELFSFSRIIWDEFPYQNPQVAEFVANCPTSSKWMLSGTPPLEKLGDIARIAHLFNIHLARPIALVAGRQPRVCEHPPPAPLSTLEQAQLYHSRYSPTLLKERHEAAIAFVRKFMRKNRREVEVKSITRPVILSSSPLSRTAYLELQQALQNRTYNANRLSGDIRRRLMSRVDWKITKHGAERAMESLVLRAASSYKDVRDNISSVGLLDSASVTTIASMLYDFFTEVIKDMEDRGRELLGKAIYLAYRLAFINVTLHMTAMDYVEERQFDYFEKLRGIIDKILTVNVQQYSGWEPYESALRILIWDDAVPRMLHTSKDADKQSSDLLSASELQAFQRAVVEAWAQMEFCKLPTEKPQTLASGKLDLLKKKKDWLDVFATYLTKTPLHSRRWFYTHSLGDVTGDVPDGGPVDLALIHSLLKIEWECKVPWEQQYRDANADDETSSLVPIRSLSQPSPASAKAAFDMASLQEKDKDRQHNSSDFSATTLKRVEGELSAKVGKRVLKTHWQEEASLRGLVYKSTDILPILKKRICLDVEGKTCDKDFVSPDRCHLQVVDLPVEGKQRMRGSNIQPVFDQLMSTMDSLVELLGHFPEVYGKRNLQQVISLVTSKQWKCADHDRDDAIEHHCVSIGCGHVHCSFPNNPAGRICGVRGCTALIDQNSCILLSKITEPPRAVLAGDFDAGTLVSDPRPYLDDDESQSPKAHAVANMIRATSKTDQVVVFVQSEQIMDDVYKALKLSKIQHVTAAELKNNESEALESFKTGLDVNTPINKQKKVLVQMVSSEQAAGSNLHNANHVIFVSPLITRDQKEWDAQMQQALGRCVRFRQRKTVYVYHLLVEETIEVDALEWRMKKEIVVPRGRAVGRFEKHTAAEFLERFDAGERGCAGCDEEGRATSMLPRDDVQFLMGDDYISVVSARSEKTVATARAVAAEGKQSGASEGSGAV